MILAIIGLVQPSSGADLPRFAIYRAAIGDSSFLGPDWVISESGAKWCREHVNAAYLERYAQARGAPLVTEDDIAEYCWSRQWIRLTDTATRRWNSAMHEHSIVGEAFALVLDGVTCYRGMFWSVFSSQSPPPVPIVFDFAPKGHMDLHENFVSSDRLDSALPDQRIKALFEQLGKLTEECPEEWWE